MTEYRNGKRFLVLCIFIVFFLGGLVGLISTYSSPTPDPMKVAVILPGFLLVGGLAAYVMTQRVKVGPHSVSQGSCFGVNEMRYQIIERIDFETLMTQRGPIHQMKLRTRERKLVLTSAMDGFDSFAKDIVARCPNATVQDRRWRS